MELRYGGAALQCVCDTRHLKGRWARLRLLSGGDASCCVGDTDWVGRPEVRLWEGNHHKDHNNKSTKSSSNNNLNNDLINGPNSNNRTITVLSLFLTTTFSIRFAQFYIFQLFFNPLAEPRKDSSFTAFLVCSIGADEYFLTQLIHKLTTP